FGEDGARALYLLGRGDYLGATGDDHLALLVRAAAIERNPVLLRVLAGDRHRDGNRVSESDGFRELERLAEVDGARPGELGPQQGGDQGAAPHAVGDDLVKHVAAGV